MLKYAKNTFRNIITSNYTKCNKNDLKIRPNSTLHGATVLNLDLHTNILPDRDSIYSKDLKLVH